MHQVTQPAILYFGTPVVLISTVNEDGTVQSGTDVLGLVARAALRPGTGGGVENDAEPAAHRANAC